MSTHLHFTISVFLFAIISNCFAQNLVTDLVNAWLPVADTSVLSASRCLVNALFMVMFAIGTVMVNASSESMDRKERREKHPPLTQSLQNITLESPSPPYRLTNATFQERLFSTLTSLPDHPKTS
jgi:O-antigen/teichoic acid export membrane protein